MNIMIIENHLKELEQQLLQADIRKSRDKVDELLADEFVEFTASGRVYNKKQMIEHLQIEHSTNITLSDFNLTLLSEEVALITYRAHKQTQPPTHSLRSSIWKLMDEQWKMVFHQGTYLKQPN